MKKLLSLVFLLGASTGILFADNGIGEGIGRGWNVTVVTGTSRTIFTGRGQVRKVYLSSGPTNATGDSYFVAFSTVPSVLNGAGVGLIPNHLFQSTAGVIPTLVYQTTTTVSNTGFSLNNSWSAGDCETCYVEIGGGGEAAGDKAGGGLHVRQSVAATGEAGKAYIYWRK